METQEDTSPPPEGEGEPKENQQESKNCCKNQMKITKTPKNEIKTKRKSPEVHRRT